MAHSETSGCLKSADAAGATGGACDCAAVTNVADSFTLIATLYRLSNFSDGIGKAMISWVFKPNYCEPMVLAATVLDQASANLKLFANLVKCFNIDTRVQTANSDHAPT